MKISRMTLAMVLLLLTIPSHTFARHNDKSVDVSSLDDDRVDEFPVPVLFGVDIVSLVPDFGDPRGGGTRSHEGQDMRAPKGTPIVSPTDAVVLRTGSGSSAGLYVYTRNPGGETFRYMHLDSIADIERGDELEPGDLIGTVGDTGNAPDGVYHLHLEIRDDENDAQDPYPRLTDEFTLKEKMSFMRGILRAVDEDEDEYAEFLVSAFPTEFAAALENKYSLPDEIEDALEDSGVLSQQRMLEKLDEVLQLIPSVIAVPLTNGSQGSSVSLLQTYLIFKSEGTARDQLALAGATGYYGPVTAAAIYEYQENQDLDTTSNYDVDTRASMLRE